MDRVISTVFSDTAEEKEAKRIRNKEGMYRRFGLFCVFAVLMIVLAGQAFASEEVRVKCIYTTSSVRVEVLFRSTNGVEPKILELAQGKDVFYTCKVITANGTQFINGAAKGGR